MVSIFSQTGRSHDPSRSASGEEDLRLPNLPYPLPCWTAHAGFAREHEVCECPPGRRLCQVQTHLVDARPAHEEQEKSEASQCKGEK